MYYLANLLRLVTLSALLFPIFDATATQLPSPSEDIRDHRTQPAIIPVLAQANGTSERKAEADHLYRQGFQQFNTSQYQASIESWQAALEIYREIGSRKEEGDTLNALGTLLRIAGQPQVAINLHQQALDIAREIDDRRGEANALSTLGDVYYSLGQYEQAIDFYQQSLAIDRELGNQQGEAYSLNNLGLIYEALGQYERAIDFHQQSLTIKRDLGDRQGEAHSLGNLGIVYSSLGQYERALDFHQQSLAIDREIGDRQGAANTLDNLGVIFYSLGQYEQTLDLLQQSLAIDREIGDRGGEANSLGNLGLVYRSMGQYEQAINFHQRQLAIAQEIGDRGEEANSLGNLGLVYRSMGQYEQAINFHQRQLAIAQEIGDRRGEAKSLNNEGSVLIDMRQFSPAESVLRQSIRAYESLRTNLPDNQLISIADTQAMAYTNLERALTAQDKTAEALAITERGRARAFVLQLASRLATPEEQAALADSSIAEVPNVAEIQQIAHDTNTTLVTYSLIFDQALYIWVVQPSGEIQFRSVEFNGAGGSGLAVHPIATIDGPVYRSTNDPSELDNLVADSRAGIIVERTEINRTQLQELHRLLIKPIAALLPTDPDEKVAFIPQGNLFLVPFAALQDDDGTALIEKHTILTAPSIQVFGLANEIRKASGDPSNSLSGIGDRALIVGNPVMPTVWAPMVSGDFGEIQLADLPGAKREAEAVGEVFGVPVLTGNQATEATVKQRLPAARWIHLATHGLLEYGDPQSSGVLDVPGAVALTPGSGEDGLLTAAEILEMDLQAELAILSACDTGRGRITGDGVVGLSRALITAGVPSVIVSLWAVPDGPTAMLMSEFYRQLNQGHDKAQALRQAMLITREQHPNPRAWAAFSLMGAAN